jgi:hypothetical protein
VSGPAGPRCPFCDSGEIELVSPFGGQIITSQFRCRACQTYFEAIREDYAPSAQPTSLSEPDG